MAAERSSDAQRDLVAWTPAISRLTIELPAGAPVVRARGWIGVWPEVALSWAGVPVATISFSEGGVAARTATASWDLRNYARGWRYALVDAATGETAAWFDGGRTIWRRGRLVVAPDHDYRLTRVGFDRRWRVAEERRRLFEIDARFPKGGTAAILALPEDLEDTPALLLLAVAVAVLEAQIPVAPAADSGGV